MRELILQGLQMREFILRGFQSCLGAWVSLSFRQRQEPMSQDRPYWEREIKVW